MTRLDRCARSFLSGLAWLAALLALLAVSACATTQDRGNALREAQYAWSAAVRWGDFEGAGGMVDPEYREAHPMTAPAFQPYQQVQISPYPEPGAPAGDGPATPQQD